MSKPLFELVDERVWMVLTALVVLTLVVLSIIGAVNASNNYVEPGPYSPEDYEYWQEAPEGQYYD